MGEELTHNHKHIVVNAFVSRPPVEVGIAEEWLRELVAKVGMTILMDSRAIYCEDLGNEGVTGLVALSTSHASFHCWHDLPRPVFNFDLYSCRDFDVDAVLAHVDEYFGLTGGTYVILDRNSGVVLKQRGRIKEARPIMGRLRSFWHGLVDKVSGLFLDIG